MSRAMMTKILMSIVATTMLFQLSLAVDYNVGAPNGSWDTSTDLQSWASAKRFFVGDDIVFTYNGTHDVLEVTKDAYDSCSTSSPISTNRTSPTTFALTNIGIRYFICGAADHCRQGMKVEIQTYQRLISGSDPDDYAPPEPDSAATVKIMTVVSMVGFGFLLMI